MVQIGTAAIANGAITTPKLATGSVTTNNIVNGSVTGSKVASGAVLIRHEFLGSSYLSSITLGPGQFGNVETKLCSTIGGRTDDVAVAVSYYGGKGIVVHNIIDEGGFWVVEAENTDKVNSQTLNVLPTCIDIVPNSKQ